MGVSAFVIAFVCIVLTMTVLLVINAKLKNKSKVQVDKPVVKASTKKVEKLNEAFC